MELDLKDKVVVVTGASKGIGLAVVKVLGREGARIVAGSRTTTPELTGLCDIYDVMVVTVDLATAHGPSQLIDAAAKRHGRIDVLVNNVGIASPRSGFLDISDDEWQRVFNLTFFSAVRASRGALPHLVSSRGAIINVGSINARLPFPMVVDYSAAKAALSNFTKLFRRNSHLAASALMLWPLARCVPLLDRSRRVCRRGRLRFWRQRPDRSGRNRTAKHGNFNRPRH